MARRALSLVVAAAEDDVEDLVHVDKDVVELLKVR
eukprot:CAMPEP_0197569658 /NCGR_PEP_ID=MMETSP1320-20131121/39385_1 /TAXON_ID=91990 /ORGANISM="Bolidomonas sp., Strain RCC2347" /LENGTH=34 /DNA_ID= /DNA_START= /DNA_END= /DNA_ORIENTATION=